MPCIQFSHANGFPAKTYTKIFDLLEDYDISTIDIHTTSINLEKINWDDLTDEIIECVKKLRQPVVGIGHSLGGILTILAAAKEPNIFQSVILLDPPIFMPLKRLMINILRNFKMDDVFSPAGKSKKRRDHFDSIKQAFEYFQSKDLFKNFNQKVLQDYVKYGLVEVENGLILKIPVKSEVAIFRNFIIKYPRSIFNVNGVLAYGVKNSIYWKSDLRWINKKFRKLKIIPFPGTHLFPFENPESTAMLIKRFL